MEVSVGARRLRRHTGSEELPFPNRDRARRRPTFNLLVADDSGQELELVLRELCP
jgi:hypothetical protein